MDGCLTECQCKSEKNPDTYECLICYEERENNNKIILTCGHELCERCFQEVEKRSNTCPFCRSTFEIEEIKDPDPEEWLNLDPREWIVYSKTDMRYGEERIYVYRTDERQPSWRNESLILSNKRNRQRRKRIKNKYRS